MKKNSIAIALFISSVFNIKRPICSKAAILLFLLILQSQAFSFSFSLNNCDPTRIKKLLKQTLLHNAFPAGTWVFDRTVQNVDLYHMITACEGKKVVFLKFNNRNMYKVEISRKEVFVTQMEKAREGFRGMKQLILPPGETAQFDCTDVKNKECLIIASQVSPAYPAEIIQFEIKDSNVSNL